MNGWRNEHTEGQLSLLPEHQGRKERATELEDGQVIDPDGDHPRTLEPQKQGIDTAFT